MLKIKNESKIGFKSEKEKQMKHLKFVNKINIEKMYSKKNTEDKTKNINLSWCLSIFHLNFENKSYTSIKLEENK